MRLANASLVIFLALLGSRNLYSEAQEQPTRKAAMEQRWKSVEEYAKKREEFSQEVYQGILQKNKVEMSSSGLVTALRDPDSSVRLAAAFFLGKQKDRAALEALTGLLKDPSSSVRLTAAKELTNLDDPSGFAVVEEETRNPDPSRRLGAVGLIAHFAKFPDKKAQVADTLVLALNDKLKDIRQLAASGLVLIGDIDAIPALKAARDRETDANIQMIIGEHVHWLEYLQSLKP
jgi:HEAT repeat protein